MMPAREGLERLREGNRRFVSGVPGHDTLDSQTLRKELATAQEPFAIILGCSDSRVPAEIIFDQSLGDLFVIRVAGNIVAPSQVGSVEFAAERFGTRLVMVLGHSMCGAIVATLEELERPTEGQSPNLRSIVDRVRPSVEALLATELRQDSDALVREAFGPTSAPPQTTCDTPRLSSNSSSRKMRSSSWVPSIRWKQESSISSMACRSPANREVPDRP